MFALAICLATAGALSLTAIPAEVSRAGVAAADNVLALLQRRSPGERGRGQLADTKPAKDKSSAAPAKRKSASLPLAVSGPEAAPGAAPEFAAPDSLPLFEGSVPDVALAPPAFGSFGPVGGGGPIFTFIGGSSSGGSTGGGSSGGGTTSGGGSTGGGSTGGGSTGGDVTTPPVTVAAVPEPETWVTMILGFGAIGVALRRRRRMPGHRAALSRAVRSA